MPESFAEQIWGYIPGVKGAIVHLWQVALSGDRAWPVCHRVRGREPGNLYAAKIVEGIPNTTRRVCPTCLNNYLRGL